MTMQQNLALSFFLFLLKLSHAHLSYLDFADEFSQMDILHLRKMFSHTPKQQMKENSFSLIESNISCWCCMMKEIILSCSLSSNVSGNTPKAKIILLFRIYSFCVCLHVCGMIHDMEIKERGRKTINLSVFPFCGEMFTLKQKQAKRSKYQTFVSQIQHIFPFMNMDKVIFLFIDKMKKNDLMI